MSEQTQLPAPILTEAQALKDKVNGLVVITNGDDYRIAGEYVVGLNGLVKSITAWFKPLKEAASQAHKRIVKAEKDALNPLEEERSHLQTIMLTYQREEERKAEERRRELERQAQEEHERLALETAIRCAEIGDNELAEEVLADAIEHETVLVPDVLPDVPKVAGLSTRTTWDFEVADPLGVEPLPTLIGELTDCFHDKGMDIPPSIVKSLRAKVIKDKDGYLIGFVRIDMVALGKVVRAMGPGAQALVGPGVRIFERKGFVGR